MSRRPGLLAWMAFVLVAVVISFPIQIMTLYGHGLDEISAVLHKLTYMNWLVIFCASVCAVLMWSASPWLKWLAPFSVLAVAINNFFVGYHGTDYSPWTATWATVAFASLHLPLLKSEIRDLLNHPERRWWRAARRRRITLPIFVGGFRRGKLRTTTYDISESGVFIPLSTRSKDAHRLLREQEQLSLCLTLAPFLQIRCDGRVVRRCDAIGSYPAGVGVAFTNLGWRQKRELRRYLARKDSPGYFSRADINSF
ncbi:MAG: PilZ domain-containing protein [Bdellovibrionales bacterium]